VSLKILGAAVGFVAFFLAMGTPLMLPLMIIGAALVIGLPVIAILRLSPSYRRDVEEAPKPVQAPREAPVERPAFKHGTHGTHAGVRFVYSVQAPEQGQPGWASVSVRVKAPGEFAVERESVGTDLARLFRMVDEFQTGDGALDREYYFSGTTEAYVRAVFGDPANLEALRGLLRAGWTSVRKDEIVLTVSRPNAEYLSAAELHQLVETLAAFRLPKTVAGASDRLRGRRALYVARVVALGICIVGVIGFYGTGVLVEGGLDFASRSFPITLGILGALLAAAYFLLRGRSMAVAGMLELAIYVPFLTIALVGVLMLANERLDAAEAHNLEVNLLTAYTTRMRRSTQYQVRFESWRGRGHEEFTVDQVTYGWARPQTGQRWHLRLREGWLGYPWIETMVPVGDR